MCLAAAYWARIESIYYANTRDDAATIGFDDAFFYEELARPPESRHVGMEPFMREEALIAFEEWAQKNDKVSY
jgi:tRNA(Arg) A34 adenosine deaminase TadA